MAEGSPQPHAAFEKEALDRVSDGVVSFDRGWVCTYINPSGARILGFKPAELIGKNWWDVFPEVRDLPFREACESSLTKQEPSFREDYFAPWGRWFHSNIFPSNGGFTVYFREVTDQKLTIQALRESEETMRGLLIGASEAVIAVNESGIITIVNGEAERTFGYRAGELIGESVQVLLPERLRAAHEKFLAHYATSPEVRRLGRGRELVGMRRNGTEFPVEVSLSPVQTRSGLLVMAMMTDVTERQKAEVALRKSMNRLQLLHEIDQAILSARSPATTARATLRRVRAIVNCQRASVSLWDPQSDELALLAVEVAGATSVRPAHPIPFGVSGLRPEFKTGKSMYVRDVLVVDPEPPYLSALVSEGLRSCLAVPLMAEGELIGSMALWSSQTGGFTKQHTEIAREVAVQLSVALRQARLLEQVQRHAVELEKRVAERTAELESANEELEAFASTAAHDLRSPLRAMASLSSRLLEDGAGRLDESSIEHIQQIMQAARQMDGLIQDLLDYSRLALDDVVPEQVSLDDVVDHVMRFLDESLRRSGAAVDLPGEMPSVLGNHRILVQVVSNLLSNAILFVPTDRRPMVKIRAETRDGRVRLSMEDNGIGIAEKDLERIFAMFERLQSLEAYPGTGIGLAIVRKGMDRMGGSVGVESRPGKGSRFWIELPSAPA